MTLSEAIKKARKRRMEVLVLRRPHTQIRMVPNERVLISDNDNVWRDWHPYPDDLIAQDWEMGK